MGTTLYQKYRPKTFSDIYGQDNIAKALKNAVSLDYLTHAYIFAGPRGVGKTTFAKIFAKAVNCLSTKNGDACDKCQNCNIVASNSALDIIELDAASNNGVEEIRSLIETVGYQPVQLIRKVYILDEAHMLTNGAWNALLKTLEDCPKHVIFIFATTEPHKIPLTIMSRCQSYYFQKFNDGLVEKLINDVCKQEKININANAVKKIIELSDGSARDALSILNQCSSFSMSCIDTSLLERLFGLVDDEKKINFLKCIKENDIEKLINLIDEFTENGVNYSVLINDLLTILVDCFSYSETKNIKILKKISVNEISNIGIEKEFLIPLIDIFLDLQTRIKFFPQPDSAFKLVSFKCAELFASNKNRLKIVEQGKLKNDDNIVSLNKNIKNKDINFVSEKETEIDIEKKDFDNPDIEKIFISLAIEHNSNIKKQYDTKLKELKITHWSKINNELKILCNAEKVLLGADKGFVLLFGDKINADLVNANTFKKKFANAVNDFFGKPLFVIGVDKQIAKTYTQIYKKNKEDWQYQLDLNDIKVLLKKSNLTKIDFVKKHFKKLILV